VLLARWDVLALALNARPAQAQPASSDLAAAANPEPAATAGPSAVAGNDAETPNLLHQRVLRIITGSVVDWFEPEPHRNDLTIRNFLSYGWTEAWTEPDEGPADAPRFRLLRIQRAFWERELRLTYNYAFDADEGRADEQEGEFELEMPVSRRFLIEIEGAVTDLKPDGASSRTRASDLKIIPEVMLAEDRNTFFSSGLVVRVPAGGKAADQACTSLTPYSALWRDMGYRVGLHTYFGAEFPIDGFGPDVPVAVLQYAIAPAITLTPKTTPHFGNFTLFMEMNGESDLGRGDARSRITLLPGMRWRVIRDVWVATGYEFPVKGREFEGRLWLSVYLDF
jgi:hypothetical protein